MRRIHVQFALPADRRRSFELLSNHCRFLRGPGVSCELIRPGHTEPNGLGAIRRVDAGNMIFHEDIVVFDRPVAYQYLITRLEGSLGRWLPIRHKFGRIELDENGDQTSVGWISEFEIAIPILGTLLEATMGKTLERAFLRLLEQARSDLLEADGERAA